MPNTLTINFIPCTPEPVQGYNLKWRVAGSGDPYTDEGNFFTSPIVFIESINPEGTCYEGTLQSVCTDSGDSGELLSEAIPWATTCAESGGAYEITLSGGCLPGNPFSNFIITGGIAGDSIKVRVSFTGTITKIGGLFTRADLGVSSPDGTTDNQSSACYTDSSPHFFSVTADSNIIIPVSGTTTVNTNAIVHNSSESSTTLVAYIIEVNGNVTSFFANGCKGNSATGGAC